MSFEKCSNKDNKDSTQRYEVLTRTTWNAAIDAAISKVIACRIIDDMEPKRVNLYEATESLHRLRKPK